MRKAAAHRQGVINRSGEMPEMMDPATHAIDGQDVPADDADEFDAELVSLLAVCEQCAEQ